MGSLNTIRAFSALAPSYDKTAARNNWTAPERVFQAVQRHRIQKTYSSQQTVYLLDVGIGTGLVSQYFKEAANNIYIEGIDASQEMLDICKQKGIAKKLTCQDVDQGLCWGSNVFDIVVSSGVFEFVGDSNRLVKDMANVTRPGGLICFTTEIANVDIHGNTYTPEKDSGHVFKQNLTENDIVTSLDLAGLKLLDEPEEFTSYGNHYDGHTHSRLFIAQKPIQTLNIT